ncbi:MAG: aviRb [Thermoleophilia bacterium]|nr:aviRb [Thermoleophilia bacterium]
MIDIVTSPQNPQLKLARKLQRRRPRETERLFLVEGEDLVVAGLQTGAKVRSIFLDAERPPAIDVTAVQHRVLHVEPELLRSVSELAHAPRAMGIFEMPAERDAADLLTERRAPWIVLDGVGDPGNVGTVLRTAAAFDAGGIIALPGTADIYNGKAVRASMGACFRLPVVHLASAQELLALRDRPELDLQIVALDGTGATLLQQHEFVPGSLIVLGGERDGVADLLFAGADATVHIAQNPDVESVNVAIAASLALYEWSRTR